MLLTRSPDRPAAPEKAWGVLWVVHKIWLSPKHHMTRSRALSTLVDTYSTNTQARPYQRNICSAYPVDTGDSLWAWQLPPSLTAPYGLGAIFLDAIGTSLWRQLQQNAARLADSEFLILIAHCAPELHAIGNTHYGCTSFDVCVGAFLVVHSLVEMASDSKPQSCLSLCQCHDNISALSRVCVLSLQWEPGGECKETCSSAVLCFRAFQIYQRGVLAHET